MLLLSQMSPILTTPPPIWDMQSSTFLALASLLLPSDTTALLLSGLLGKGQRKLGPNSLNLSYPMNHIFRKHLLEDPTIELDPEWL